MDPPPRRSRPGPTPQPQPQHLLPLLVLLSSLALPLCPAAQATSWQSVNDLRAALQRVGVRVVQQDCPQKGLQGLYDRARDTIVVCRTHSTAAGVWNTLAHEATHRMQACAGGSIVRRGQGQQMANTLAKYSPNDLRALRHYPSNQHQAEVEARYTAQLPPEQVINLLHRYCGGRPAGPDRSIPITR